MTHLPHDNVIDLQEISTRNASARHIITGFSTVLPTLTEIWRYLDTALADVLVLSAEIVRQREQITAIRLDRADLLAAIRATLAAHHDGETDPLFYIRDEAEARGQSDPGTRGHR